jgi:hypothetical protein
MTTRSLPVLTNGDVIQQLTNDHANLYLNFHQIPIHIHISAPIANLPEKRKAISQAIGLHLNIFASL